MKSDKDIKGHALMFIAGVLWGLNSPVMKSLLSFNDGMITPMAISLFRMIGAALLFWVASFFAPKEQVRPHDMLLLFFASIFALSLNQGSFSFGLRLTSPLDASIITTTAPIITMIFAALFLKEPITGKKVIGVFTGAVGALLLIINGQQQSTATGNHTIWGNILCLLSQFSYAIYLTVFKGLIERYSTITLMKWMFTYASVCFIPFSFRDVGMIEFGIFSTNSWMQLFFAVFCATFLTYLCLSYAQKKLRPTIIGMYNYVQPLVAGIVAISLGMDTFGFLKGLAVIFVFLGVYIVTQSKSKAEIEVNKKDL